MCVCVCVCACEREREREREIAGASTPTARPGCLHSVRGLLHGSPSTPLSSVLHDRLVGLVVKAPASIEADRGFDSRLRRVCFPGHTSD